MGYRVYLGVVGFGEIFVLFGGKKIIMGKYPFFGGNFNILSLYFTG